MDDKAKDAYLRKKYGITLLRYTALLAACNGGCGICGSKPQTRGLHVDHDHKYKQVKIIIKKLQAGVVGLHAVWDAAARYRGRTTYIQDIRKNLAVRCIREELKRESVRGLICYNCNLGLRRFRDNPTFLRNAAAYLEKHQGVTNGN